MNILALTEKSVAAQIAAVETGFPSDSLDVLVKRIGLPKHYFIAGLQFRSRTVSLREKNHARFPLHESERLFRVVRVYHLARRIFSTSDAVAEWLNSPDRSLSGKTPLAMLATELGGSKVVNLLQAMSHGVPI